MVEITTIGTHFRTTVPKEMRKHLNLSLKDKLIWTNRGRDVVVVKFIEIKKVKKDR